MGRKSKLKRGFVRSYLKSSFKGVPMPLKSSTKGYIVCPECGAWFSDNLHGVELYAQHYIDEHIDEHKK